MSSRHLNLGSGQRPFDSPFINVDCQARWKPDVVADISKLSSADNTAEEVVLHHVLEHFGLTEGEEVLRECYRVLAPGGSLFVFVPDTIALFQALIDGRINDYIFAVNLMGAYMGDEADRHKWCFNRRSLHTALTGAGFTSVKDFDYRPIPGADLARDFWILAYEAVK